MEENEEEACRPAQVPDEMLPWRPAKVADDDIPPSPVESSDAVEETRDEKRRRRRAEVDAAWIPGSTPRIRSQTETPTFSSSSSSVASDEGDMSQWRATTH